MQKVVIASDSFKGCLSSMQVAEAAGNALRLRYPDCKVVKLAVADGGEGTVDALLRTMGGERFRADVQDPLGRIVSAEYAVIDNGSTAVMEISAACGLTLLLPDERNPMLTSTYGAGQLIADALDRGCRKFLVGIGGSATNDAGMGMLDALGWCFYDHQGRRLKGQGASLSEVAVIDSSNAHPSLIHARFLVACDVSSPFHGPEGAAYVYAPQKGATPQMVEALDDGMRHFAEVIRNHAGCDISQHPGAGAAGGLGGTFKAFLNAELCKGADMVLDAVGFDEIIKDADLIITGEGRIDSQTSTGKLPYVVASRAYARNIPVLALCGTSKVDSLPYVTRICPVTPPDMPLETAMTPSVAAENILQALLDS